MSKAAYPNAAWISISLINFFLLCNELTSEIEPGVSFSFRNLNCPCLITTFDIGQTAYDALECIDLIYYDIGFPEALPLL